MKLTTAVKIEMTQTKCMSDTLYERQKIGRILRKAKPVKIMDWIPKN
jgi:hypothetical protein